MCVSHPLDTAENFLAGESELIERLPLRKELYRKLILYWKIKNVIQAEEGKIKLREERHEKENRRNYVWKKKKKKAWDRI